jgi:hypothetical protein
MNRQSHFAAGVAAILLGLPAPSLAQNACYQVVAYIAPNPMRCQEVGRDFMGRPIWLCC